MIRNTIRNGIKILKNTSSEYQWVKLCKTFFNLEKDIFICFSYISPCNFQTKSDSDTIEAVFRDMNLFNNTGQVLMCGDLNARTGSEIDFIIDDTDKHIPIDPQHVIDQNIQQRKSQDTKLDDRGKQILDMCISSRMRILNGRTTGDLLGKCTCQKPNSSSVVDYVISSEELLKDVIYFHVHEFKPLFSDCHCKISFSIKASFQQNTYLRNNEKMPKQFKWNKYSAEKFKRALNNQDIVFKIKSFLSTEFDLNDNGIDSACSKFEDIIISVANQSLSKIQINSTRQNKNKKWYDEELYIKRRDLNRKATNMFKNPFNKSLRDSYFKCYRKYRKLVKYKKKSFNKLVISQLDDLETKDPKAYWKLVNSLKEDSHSNSPEKSIDTDTWHDYFENLNSVNEKYTERTKVLDGKLRNFETATFNLLDCTIKEKEIRDSSSKLHNNKATGFDTIKNEMLKHGLSDFLPCLRKLFNLILSSGNYPLSWATGYISPIFKTLDSSKPENYRGITITFNVGKLFNLILNSRLDKFLEDNELIDKSQIGFTKKARTQDHMFVLKTLIDKYTNKAGGKLFACFVDFKKAFDSVIHPGLKIKLKEMNISGKFYDVINSMYSKTKLCVRIGENRSNFFKSDIGVRQGDVLSPNLFKFFINDLPSSLSECLDPVNVNGNTLQCLMYADDIVLLSTSSEGLQQRLNILNEFCKEWCLDLNVSKTKILIFNKAGKLIKDTLYYSDECLECVQHYRYLGVYFSASGMFNYGQNDIFNKARKATFKVTKLITSAEPSVRTSLHLYDHLIKPILLYGSEIWGVFKTNSKACKKDESFLFPSIYKTSFADKSHVSFLKYTLGVNKYSSNLAALSETGRLPMYFSVIISIVKYLHRLENSSDGKKVCSLGTLRLSTFYNS